LGERTPLGLAAEDDEARVGVATLEEAFGVLDAGLEDEAALLVGDGTTRGVDDAALLLEGEATTGVEVATLLEDATALLAEGEVPELVHFPKSGLHPVPLRNQPLVSPPVRECVLTTMSSSVSAPIVLTAALPLGKTKTCVSLGASTSSIWRSDAARGRAGGRR